ncbi:MAG: SMC-Scp complex subunit ScpB, partial [Candidatus Hermodarchaeota archaeon]
MNENNDKEPENQLKFENDEEAPLDEVNEEEIPQEGDTLEDNEIILKAEENVKDEGEDLTEVTEEEFRIEEEESLVSDALEDAEGELDTEYAEDEEKEPLEPLEPQELTKEELELQLKILRRNLIEGALYAAGRPLDVEELSTKLEIPKKEVEELVRVVAFDYLEREGALIVAQIGEKYQMQLRPELTETVSKFAKGGAIAERYLRTLTVIALKQPILKSTVIKIRGTGAYEHIKYLFDNDL